MSVDPSNFHPAFTSYIMSIEYILSERRLEIEDGPNFLVNFFVDTEKKMLTVEIFDHENPVEPFQINKSYFDSDWTSNIPDLWVASTPLILCISARLGGAFDKKIADCLEDIESFASCLKSHAPHLAADIYRAISQCIRNMVGKS